MASPNRENHGWKNHDAARHRKEKLLKDWQLMEKIADAGKICV
jgi:hypothetical protein